MIGVDWGILGGDSTRSRYPPLLCSTAETITMGPGEGEWSEGRDEEFQRLNLHCQRLALEYRKISRSFYSIIAVMTLPSCFQHICEYA